MLHVIDRDLRECVKVYPQKPLPKGADGMFDNVLGAESVHVVILLCAISYVVGDNSENRHSGYKA